MAFVVGRITSALSSPSVARLCTRCLVLLGSLMEKEYSPAAPGLAIAVRTRSGTSWDAIISEVVERSAGRLLVRTRRLDP